MLIFFVYLNLCQQVLFSLQKSDLLANGRKLLHEGVVGWKRAAGKYTGNCFYMTGSCQY